MNISEIKTMLTPYGLKLTLPRLKVLQILLSKDSAVTYAELLRLTEHTIDRVTVYRTLRSFEEAGIIHRIIGAGEALNYALSNNTTANLKMDSKQHIHFNCLKCHHIYCLDDYIAPQITLPEQYEVHSLNITLVGVCRKCNLS